MRTLVLAAIKAYQRYLSPHKGFCCAYRHHTGRSSCSTLGFRAIRRYGVIDGVAVLRRRLYLCGVAHRRYGVMRRRPHRAQRGDCLPCDLPCDPNCDFSCDKPSNFVSDFLNFCDCGDCNWPDRKSKGSEEEQHVHIPPHTV
ncbi:MAG: membrane protein insertion efficiency factor YidD [Azonexus sp.]|nr:membrane protein insertion efficiency factor YidD [Azonexus sp.]